MILTDFTFLGLHSAFFHAADVFQLFSVYLVAVINTLLYVFLLDILVFIVAHRSFRKILL